MSLEGKVVLITGGVKNLGAAIAKELAPLGASLALHYHSDSAKEDATKLEQELKTSHPNTKVHFHQGNLTTEKGVNELFAFTLEKFGKVDIVINTVGKVLKKPAADITEEEYDDMFA